MRGKIVYADGNYSLHMSLPTGDGEYEESDDDSNSNDDVDDYRDLIAAWASGDFLFYYFFAYRYSFWIINEGDEALLDFPCSSMDQWINLSNGTQNDILVLQGAWRT